MQIQINTDHNIDGHEAMLSRVRSTVEAALNRVSNHVTRVEVHLSDENGNKGGPNDKRCVMEGRLEGREPVAVTEDGETVDQVVHSAADKLAGLIESTLERLRDQGRRD